MRRRLLMNIKMVREGVFSNDSDINEIIAIVTEFNKNADVKFGAA
ncbi:hypothetical protein DSM106972_087290 [Dulcicalothrix desertica PCC 7102]|uniref:Uncharacterized protein n=1 Tax=Dulcicalothrix desertica PCC 7102 TaxID=232991 RepID=A0A433URS2_9CYAN|nr:hypothetical protein [Dulcicalothrix desertica]RUS96542.1 hypothetical protein DSM106972_087290 [Dulcicalothrix desertica PCC 7102]TWH51386.1 hypothetical protein CAL7102_05795 [Dulcicalothrix desertica PCC 7102]